MDNTSIDRDALEEKLHDPTASAIPLPFEFLKDITCNFSDDQELGRGGYGVVYKGILRSGKTIAVKKLFGHLVDDDQFQKEVTNLIGIRHQNIVQLVGYCAEPRSEAMKLQNGTYVLAQIPKNLICFEYLGNKSLDKHISDESCGLDWNKRYEIIKGICSGLHFLHGECHIVNLDLKPQNILMDSAMIPKIADFGLSMLLDAQKSHTIISGNVAGTRGYMAPEYLIHNIVSPKADIFSFGVIIIEIITGGKNFPIFQEFNENVGCQSTGISLNEYRENVIGRWRDVFNKERKHTSPETYTEQVERCITIALECLKHNSRRRPTACDIYQMLTGQICSSCEKAMLLSAHQVALRFHFTEYREVTSFPLALTNNTDDPVAFRMVTNEREKYFPSPVHGLVLPRSSYTLPVTLRRPAEHDDTRFTIKLESTITDKQNVQASSSYEYNNIFAEAKKKGREVHQLKLLCLIAHERGNVIISRHPASFLYGMFIHPSKTWIITVGNMGETVNILEYQKQKTVDSSEFVAFDRTFKAMFIPRKQWFVVGCFSGHIKVYNYETKQEVKTFRAHDEYVTSLDIHPSEPCVLSASFSDRKVKLWNWEKEWECIQAIEMEDVRLAKFNPKDADYIACTTPTGVKVLNIASPGLLVLSLDIPQRRRRAYLTDHDFTPVWSSLLWDTYVWSLEYLLTPDDKLYLITGRSNGRVEIWDYQSRSCLKSLKAHKGAVSTVCAHPDLPILITGSYDGTVCLWNSYTFKVETELRYHLRDVYAIACLKGSNRIAIGHRDGIAVTEI